MYLVLTKSNVLLLRGQYMIAVNFRLRFFFALVMETDQSERCIQQESLYIDFRFNITKNLHSNSVMSCISENPAFSCSWALI
jgi:hypothetical protein